MSVLIDIIQLAIIIVVTSIAARFLPPALLVVALASLSGYYAFDALETLAQGTLRPARLLLAVILATAALGVWHRSVRGRPEVYRSAIFGFGRVGDGRRGRDQ